MKTGCLSVGLTLLLAGCATTQIPLSEALGIWAQRTNMQVIVPSCPETKQLVRRAEHLEQLIAGTRLGYTMINERTVAIVCPRTP